MGFSPDSEGVLPEPSQQEIKQTIFSMVWPVATENILQLLIGFVNTAMVGRLGAAPILAVGLSGRVSMFVWIIFGAIGTGATVLTAQAFGAGDHDRIRKVAKQAFLAVFALMGLIVWILYTFAPTFMDVLKATPESAPMGATYLRYMVFSIPFQGMFLVISSILRGMGNTRTTMQIALTINIVNVVLNSLLIFGRFGLPALGYRGPAVSTIIGQAVGAVLAVTYFLSPSSGVNFNLKEKFSLEFPLIRRILSIGLPSSAEMFLWQVAGITLFRLVNDFGTAAGASYQLGLQAEGISYMPTAGFGIAATALVGRSLGASNPNLAERYTKQLVTWGVMLTSFTTALLVFFPKALMRILTDDPPRCYPFGGPVRVHHGGFSGTPADFGNVGRCFAGGGGHHDPHGRGHLGHTRLPDPPIISAQQTFRSSWNLVGDKPGPVRAVVGGRVALPARGVESPIPRGP